MSSLERKFLKHNKLLAWFLILSVIFSLGVPVWSEDPGTASTSELTEEEENEDVTYDLPRRDEDYVLEKMELFAETDDLELYVLEKYEYTGKENVYADIYVYDENGELLDYQDGMFKDNQVPIYDENGEKVLNDEGNHRIESTGAFNRETEELGEDDNGEMLTATRFTYKSIVAEDVAKIKEEGIFAVRVKSNGFVWWSNPVNAVHDPYAKGAQVNSLSSPISFVAGNPVSYSSKTYRSNTVKQASGPNNFNFVNACEKIEKTDNGARFHYNFPEGYTKIIMEVTLDGGSVLVTIPQDGIQEDRITPTPDKPQSASVILALSVLNSFGAAPAGEDGYIVVADGSGAVIEFDNGKTNSAQYSGKVYGRDYAVSQKFAPPVTQQVYLPVYGIVRDKGENALVAIAEKGDENATIRAAVSRQGANSTAYNLAWFDFTIRTVDSFYIGTNFEELTIYETGGIKTGDIAVRYYPLAGNDLSYADVADTYRNYLVEHKGVTQKDGAGSLPFFMTLNGGTVKAHSIAGFPVDLQTQATSYSQAQKIVQELKNAGVNDLVIAYNDVNTASIKRQISDTMKYSSKLGGKKDYQDLANAVKQNGFVLYPSLGLMEYHKSGGGYSFMRSSSREVTRSRAYQQKYELAFGTPDPLAKSSTILSPYYFTDAFDNIIKSFKDEGVDTISLGNATTLLYSDFSRKNPYGNIYFNRRDTVQVLTEGFQKLNDAGISILAQAANAYALPYVSHISDIPLSSSNYDIFDYDVPFYQMAVSGLVACSAKPFNASADLNALTLLALSTATPIHYEFIYESPGEFNDSNYNSKFYAGYQGWVNDAVNTYKMFNDLVGDIAGERIVGHRRVSVNEYETVFEGGRKININLSTDEIKIDGEKVDLSQYNVKSSKGGGVK